MDPRDQLAPDQLQILSKAFSDQLAALLEETAHGRSGLFSDLELTGKEEDNRGWPEAARLRQLAIALQNIFALHQQRNALCDEFIDLCSIHGENHPGEPRLARMFLARIECGQVGTPTEEPMKPG